MAKSHEEIQTWLNNYAMFDIQPTRAALYSCVSLRNKATENQTGFIISQNNKKYIATLANHPNAISGIIKAKNFDGQTFSVTLKGTNGFVALYRATALDNLLNFRWYDDPIKEGLSVSAVGDQTDTFYTLTNNYIDTDLDFSVTEGFISRINSPLAPSWGSTINDVGPYIRHTTITNPLRTTGRGGSFGGPLFTMKRDTCGIRYPALLGMNFYTYYRETADPTYVGISFAISQQDLQKAITAIVG